MYNIEPFTKMEVTSPESEGKQYHINSHPPHLNSHGGGEDLQIPNYNLGIWLCQIILIDYFGFRLFLGFDYSSPPELLSGETMCYICHWLVTHIMLGFTGPYYFQIFK